MELKDLFYQWVPIWVKLPVLFLLFFVTLTANGVYTGNTLDMYSSLGVYTEPYTAAYNAIYIGMGLGLMVELRLKRRWSNKTLLFWGLGMLLLTNIACALSDNPELVVAACLVLGFAKITALIEVYLIWLFIWSKKGDTSRLYPFVYFTALPGIYLVTWITTQLAHTYNWRYAYIFIILLILVSLLLSLFLVENHPLKRIYPLYQMDWTGLLLLTVIMMLINYVAVYGKVEDWWASDKIKGAVFLLPVAVCWFIKRELTLKRPLLNLQLFKEASFRKGLFYFFILGIFLPGNIQSTFTGGILHYEMIRNTELNLYMIPGILAGAVLCYTWYFYKRDPTALLFSGFLAFVVYYILLYNSLVSDFGIQGFWLPSIIKGFGTAVLYIVIGLYAVSAFGLDKILTASGIMILMRSFLGSGVFSSLYTYFLYTGRLAHLNYIAGLTDGGDYAVHQAGGAVGYYKTIQEQATLTASKELSGVIILLGLGVLVLIIAGYLHRKYLKSRLKPVTP